MEADRAKQILEETGGDALLADLFIEAQIQHAKDDGEEIPEVLIEIFYKEVEVYRNKLKKRGLLE